MTTFLLISMDGTHGTPLIAIQAETLEEAATRIGARCVGESVMKMYPPGAKSAVVSISGEGRRTFEKLMGEKAKGEFLAGIQAGWTISHAYTGELLLGEILTAG